MTEFAPISGYYQTLKPFNPRPCQTPEYPITVHLTLASIDPEPVDDEKQPTTLRLLKQRDMFEVDDSEDEDYNEEEDDKEENDDDDDDDDEKKPSKKSSKKNAKKSGKKDAKDEEEDESDGDEIEETKEMDEEIQDHILCTLSPESQCQQVLDLTIMPGDEVYFVATGSYTVYLSGNYVDNPDDLEDDDFSSSEDDEDEDEDPDYEEGDENEEDEEGDVIEEGDDDFDLDKLENVDDVEKEIEDLVKKDEGKKKQSGKKRKAEKEESGAEGKSKKSKKAKKDEEERRVKFDKDLIKGPTQTEKKEKKEKKEKIEKKKKKHPVRKLDGGILVEDMVTGVGPLVKSGKKISVRYVGKLRNGKVFDKNVSGKPFRFNVGRGEVIKGWDLGFQGMAVGGERRIIIPAPMAYGSQRLPGIPANSELTFDVKLLAIK